MKNCSKIKEILPFYVACETDQKENVIVESHIKECARCSRELAHYQLISSSLKDLKVFNQPPEFWDEYQKEIYDKIRKTKEEHIAGKTITFWRLPLLIFRTAALFLIGIIIGYFITPFVLPSKPGQSAPVSEENKSAEVAVNEELGLKVQHINQSLQPLTGQGSLKQSRQGPIQNYMPEGGLVVSGFLGNSISEASGIKLGDIIIEINGKAAVKNFPSISQDVINLKILREGKLINIAIRQLEDKKK